MRPSSDYGISRILFPFKNRLDGKLSKTLFLQIRISEKILKNFAIQKAIVIILSNHRRLVIKRESGGDECGRHKNNDDVDDDASNESFV